MRRGKIYRLGMIGAAVWCVLTLTACSVKTLHTEKLRDVEFTVVAEDDIPEELKTEIEEGKEEPLRLSYSDAGYLYAVRGYGKQETSGYSVTVDDCYETEDAICVETSLLGPAHGEEILETPTYPYIVIKMEYTEKQVIYQ